MLKNAGGKNEQFKMSKETIEIMDNYQTKLEEQYWGKVRANHVEDGRIAEMQPSWTASFFGQLAWQWEVF